MKVYVAGGSSERLTVIAPLIDRLRDAGVDITFDWTRWEGWQRPNDSAVIGEAARRSMRGIVEADVVWLVVPKEKSEGSAGELGIALGLGKACIVSGETGARNIWTTMCEVRFSTHGHALEWVLEMKRKEDMRHGRDA